MVAVGLARTAGPRGGDGARAKPKKAGLGKWFGEKWVDVKTGKPCGRKAGEKRG